MTPFVTTLHLILATALILAVMLQPARAGLGGGFGSSSELFSARGPSTALARATPVIVTLFMGTSVFLAGG